MLREFPYSNFHELNLDWIMERTKETTNAVNSLELEVNAKIEFIKNLVNDAIDSPKYNFANVKNYGAVGNGVHDDRSSIIKCLEENNYAYFPAGIYRVSDTITVSHPCVIKGFTTALNTPASEIRFDNGNKSGLVFSFPTLQDSLYVSDLIVSTRTNTESYVPALSFTNVSDMHIENIRVFGFSDGFHVNKCNYGSIEKCAFEISHNNGRGFIIGNLPGEHLIGNGNNASVTVRDCVVTNPQNRGNTIGMFILGYPSDTFIDHFECARCNDGIHVQCDSTYWKRGYSNIWIRNCVIDAYTGTGIIIEGSSTAGNVVVDSCYVSPAFNLTTENNGIRITNSQASMNISNNMIINYDPTPNTTYTGIKLQNTANVRALNNQITNMRRALWTSGSTVNVYADNSVYNNTNPADYCYYAENRVYVGHFDGTFNGAENMVTANVISIESTSDRVTINNSGINGGIISSSGHMINAEGNNNYSTVGRSASGKTFMYGF